MDVWCSRPSHRLFWQWPNGLAKKNYDNSDPNQQRFNWVLTKKKLRSENYLSIIPNQLYVLQKHVFDLP